MIVVGTALPLLITLISKYIDYPNIVVGSPADRLIESD